MKKIFTLAAAVLASLSLWAAETVNTGTYSTQTISEDFTTSTWAFAKPSSNVNIPIGAKENDIIYEASSSGKVKVGSSNLSWQGVSSVYIYVPAGAAGTISWTTSSSSESRYAQLYINGEAAGEKRLYSKDSGTGEITSDGKKGPQSLAFTAADLTTRNDSTFLHFKDNDKELKIASIKVVLTTGDYANCTNPEAHLAFTQSTAFVGEQFSYDFGSKSGGDLNDSYTLNGVPAVKGTDYTFTSGNITVLKAGQFVMHMIVGAVGDYCAADLSDTILINEATPVAACAIEGPATAYIGKAVTFTATAANASDYAWTVNGVDANTNAAEFTYTPAAAGEYSIVCSARNKFNAANEWIASEPIALNVTKLCGDLITATLNGGSSATMGGVVGGTFDTNLGSGKYKVDKGVYIGVKLASGTFMAGDVVTITMSTAGQNYPCLFGDKDRTNLLYLAEEVSEATEYQIILPAAATGLTSIYLSRDADDATYKWNPTVSTISVSRSCEASSNAEIAGLTINGEAVEAENGVYSYEVSATENLSQVAVVYTLAHPLASATPASGFTIDVPAAGADANSQVITVTAENGTEKTYTVLVAKAAALSDNADLRELTVAGYALAPEFDAAVLNYTIEKAYAAQMPTLDDVTALTDHNAAKATIVLNDNVFTITVTAEDKSTKVYTITVNTAAAKKDLLEVTFSNGVHGFIANGEIKVPYLAGTTQPTFVSARFWNADGEPSATVVDGKLVVTGIDEVSAEYTLTYEELTPMTMTTDTITFDAVPSYIYSVYGWDADKGVKFSKDVEEAANKRISEGKCRIYIALPAAKEVALISGTTGARPVTVSVNGVVNEDITKTADKGKAVTIALNGEAANLVAFESNGNNGDAGFVKMVLTESTPTGITNTEAAVKAVKVVREGKLFIEKNGVLYNAQGNVVK